MSQEIAKRESTRRLCNPEQLNHMYSATRFVEHTSPMQLWVEHPTWLHELFVESNRLLGWRPLEETPLPSGYTRTRYELVGVEMAKSTQPVS